MDQRHPDLERGDVEADPGHLQEDIVVTNLHPRRVVHEPVDRPVRDHDAFRLTGGAGRVAHVSGGVRVHRRRAGRSGRSVRRGIADVHDNVDIRYEVAGVRVDNGEARRGIAQDAGPLLGRLGRVEVQVRPAGLPGSGQRDDQLRRTHQDHGDDGSTADPGGAQPPGQLLRPVVELPVGQCPVPVAHRDAVWSALNLVGHHLVDAPGLIAVWRRWRLAADH
jgi:hypothetical protein